MSGEDALIRHLERGELDALVDAQNEIFQDYIIPLRSSRQFFLDFQRSVGGGLKDILVAVRDGSIVGYVNPVIDRKEAWIGGVGVIPPLRNRGIGAKLMLAAEDLCVTRGVRELYLEVIEGNTRAEKLYERLGFERTRKFLTAEGRPAKFEGFGILPEKAELTDLIPLHDKSYGRACWQKRKVDALIQSAQGAECYTVDGGFVLVRTVDTSGFIPFLGVVPEKRGRGIGTSLAKFALTRLWHQGAFKAAAYNINDDLPTLRMLDKFDFKVTMRQTEMKKDI